MGLHYEWGDRAVWVCNVNARGDRSMGSKAEGGCTVNGRSRAEEGCNVNGGHRDERSCNVNSQQSHGGL